MINRGNTTVITLFDGNLPIESRYKAAMAISSAEEVESIQYKQAISDPSQISMGGASII